VGTPEAAVGSAFLDQSCCNQTGTDLPMNLLLKTYWLFWPRWSAWTRGSQYLYLVLVCYPVYPSLL